MASGNLPRIILSAALLVGSCALMGCGVLVGCVVLAPSRASAQDALAEDAAERRVGRARTLFADGVGLVQERRYAEAEALFREALTLRDAPAIRYNLASVLFEQGEYPEARAMADVVVADATTPEDVRVHTRELIAQMNASAGYARIDVVGGEATVDVDGYRLPDPSREIALAPGAHVATASGGEGELARAEFEIATGQHRVVSLDVSGPGAEPDLALATTATEPELAEQWWFWTAVGGGVVVVAVVIGVVAATSGGVEQPIQGNFDPGVIRW